MTIKTSPGEKAVDILVVDDSPTQAEQLKYLLEQQSYGVTVANSGAQALAHLGAHTPTLIITDIVMPEMNGYELCKKIKSNEKTTDIPVILLTALDSAEDVLEGLACGADNFISKPYNAQYLLANIIHILANKALRNCDRIRVGMEIQYSGKKYFITSDHQQMLSLLVSTYQAAVNRNNELIQAQDELTVMNERLEEMVNERTVKLTEEIARREQTEVVLQDQLKELQRWYDALLDREDRVMGLKKEVNDLLKEAGRPARYSGE